MGQSLTEWSQEELADTDDSLLAPLPVPTRCKEGDVWALGRHTLYCADSEDAGHVDRQVCTHGYASLVFTDPPFQMADLHGSKTSFIGMGKEDRPMRPVHKAISDIGMGTFDPSKFLGLLPRYFTLGMLAAFIFHSKDSAPDLLGWAKDVRDGKVDDQDLSLRALKGLGCTPLVWYKADIGGQASPLPIGNAHRPDVEYLLYLRKKGKWNNADKAPLAARGRVLFHKREKGDMMSDGGRFPCRKPAALIANQILLTTEPNDLVYDPYCGSGSTILACEDTGRRCVATERLERLCDLTISRWEGSSGRRAVKIET